ncbi:MAG: hypothetical protein AAFS13_02590 [Pseudomonadota bacterium]
MYDARKYKGGGSLKDGMAFGLFVLLAAAVSFLAAFKGPDIFNTSNNGANRVIVANAEGQLSLPDIDAKRLDAALREYDADLHVAVTTRLAASSAVTLDDMAERIFEEIQDEMVDGRDDFARMPLRYLNEVIDLSRGRLRKAVSRRDPWCAASAYKDFLGTTDPEELRLIGDRMAPDMASANTAIGQYLVDVSAILLEGATAARRSPTELGPVTDQDEAALQGLVMSLITDEQLMPVMIAAQQGTLETSLDTLNICSLGLTVVTAIRTLPEETKGRVWAGAVRGDFNPAAVQQGRSF